MAGGLAEEEAARPAEGLAVVKAPDHVLRRGIGLDWAAEGRDPIGPCVPVCAQDDLVDARLTAVGIGQVLTEPARLRAAVQGHLVVVRTVFLCEATGFAPGDDDDAAVERAITAALAAWAARLAGPRAGLVGRGVGRAS